MAEELVRLIRVAKVVDLLNQQYRSIANISWLGHWLDLKEVKDSTTRLDLGNLFVVSIYLGDIETRKV